MGCVLSSPETTKNSTVSTLMPPTEWKLNTIAVMAKVFMQEQDEEWYLEVINKINAVEESDYGFTNPKRFEDILAFRADSEDLRYDPMYPHRLWRLLEEDLSDVRNPVSSLLSTFSMTYARFSIESVHDVSVKHKADEASFLLVSIAANVLKMVYVLREAMLFYYGTIGDLLRTRVEDLDNLLMNLVVQGNLYILMQRLANIIGKDQAEILKSIILARAEDYPSDEQIPRIRYILQEFTLTENITEKRLLLNQLEHELWLSPDPQSLLMASLLSIGLQSLTSDLLLTKLLTSESPKMLYTLIECVDSATFK